jgi:hypothetical protein
MKATGANGRWKVRDIKAFMANAHFGQRKMADRLSISRDAVKRILLMPDDQIIHLPHFQGDFAHLFAMLNGASNRMPMAEFDIRQKKVNKYREYQARTGMK